MSVNTFTICIALIHNNNAERNTYIRPRLAELAGKLAARFSVSQLEVARQPPLIPHHKAMAFARDIAYWRLERQWCAYRLLSDPLWPSVKQLTRSLRKKYVANQGNALTHWQRSSAIETLVTDKHIRAWQQFLDTDADLVICLEDDAVFKEDTADRLQALLTLVAEHHSGRPVYADLAGGCSLMDLRIDRLQERRDHDYRHYKKPVTNTACAYLLSKSLAATFHATLVKEPWLRLIGIDWMMNKMLMLMGDSAESVFCVHADPTIFEHGSVQGAYKPWERKLDQ